jgi:uncharacterized protein YjbI with pentapeptide repeats
MMLVLLARTAAEFDKLLRTTIADEADQERYRARVENALFLQLLVGMKGERSGVNSFLLGLISPTIVLAPLATLVLMQMMFLPYHHLRITWWHRGIVVVDLVLIVMLTYRCFFPRGLKKAPLALGALNGKSRWATAMAVCILLAVGLTPLVDWLSFRQGRWAGEPWPSTFKEWGQWMAGEPPPSPKVNPDYTATANGVVFGLFPDRLKLKDETIVGKERWDKTKEEIASRGGDFVPTIKFEDGRDLQAADLSGADLRGVSLNAAAMQGANLVAARLDGARLGCAELGDSWVCAQLQGVNLTGTQLQGADLHGAQLHGAQLVGARLQGADLSEARLPGADLRGTQLQGANLYGAHLKGANLSGAQLQGADLDSAELQGADLDSTELQGAELYRAGFADSSFDGTVVFAAAIAGANLSTSVIRSIRTDRVKFTDMGEVPLTAPDVDAWIAAATQFTPDDGKERIAARFRRLKPDFREDAQWVRWQGMQEASLALDPDGTRYRRRLAKLLADLACDPDSAPYMARAFVRPYVVVAEYDRLGSLGDQLAALRARMEDGRKSPAKCPGVAGFADVDWHWLEAIKPIEPAPANP